MNEKNIWHKIRVALMSITVMVFMIIGFLIFIRPTESELEKRKLAVFPSPTTRTVLDGSFFKDIVTWYADTYPLREKMIAFQSDAEELYGIRDTVIYGDTGQTADAIPSGNEETAPIISNIDEDEDTSANTAGENLSDKDNNLRDEQNIDNASTSAVKDIAENATVSGSADTVTKSNENSSVQNNKENSKDKPLKDGTLKVQPEVAGTVYIAENRGFTLYYFYKKGADLYASMLNTVAKKVENIASVYDIVVPNSFGVNLDENIQKSMNTSNQGEAIDYIYKRLNPSIRTVETYKQLRNHNSEYLYFNTDHHWTALGAYYVYRSFCEVKGITPHELKDYKKKEFPDFLGSFYAYSNQSKALAKNPDTVEAYIPIATNKETITPREGKPYTYDIISDANKFSAANKYLAFIGGDQPLIDIKNPRLSDDSSCIIIKESYGNAFVPFLVDHYQHVYVVDYRYYTGNVVNLAKKHSNTDIVFLNNTAATSVEKSKLMLGIFK